MRLLTWLFGGAWRWIRGLAWTNSYDTTTLDGSTDAPSVIDDKYNAMFAALQERLNVDHYWPLSGTTVDHADTAKHRKVTLLDQAAAPSPGAAELGLWQDDASGEQKAMITDPGVGARAGESQYLQIPAGSIDAWPGLLANLPAGWLHCDGSSVLQADYPALYAALDNGAGTCIYGEADGTHFYLPDLRGYTLRGWDNGQGIDEDAANRTAPPNGATAGDNVGTVQGDNAGDHTHDIGTKGSEGSSGTNDRVLYAKTGGTPSYIAEDQAKAETNGVPLGETTVKNVAVIWKIKY